MPLIMRYEKNEIDMSGRLTVEAAPGNLAELNALAIELESRENITVDGVAAEAPEAPPSMPPA